MIMKRRNTRILPSIDDGANFFNVNPSAPELRLPQLIRNQLSHGIPTGVGLQAHML
jgi:hypothetical protein